MRGFGKERVLKEKAKLSKIYIEVTALGFLPRAINKLNILLQKNDINFQRMNRKMSETALRCSYYLYTQRNNKWKDEEILRFY